MTSPALQRGGFKIPKIFFPGLQPRVLETHGAEAPTCLIRIPFPRAEARGYSYRYSVQFVLRLPLLRGKGLKNRELK